MRYSVVMKQTVFVSRYIEADSYGQAEEKANKMPFTSAWVAPGKGAALEDIQDRSIAWITADDE